MVHRHDHRDVAHLASAQIDGAARVAVEPDATARRFIQEAVSAPMRIIANRPDTGLPEEYEHKLREARTHITWHRTSRCSSSKCGPATSRSSAAASRSRASKSAAYRVLRCVSSAIPNAIAALFLYIRDETKQIPHAYFGWTEGNPIVYLMKFLALGEGDTAPGDS